MRPYGVYLLLSGATAFAHATAFTVNLVYLIAIGLGPLQLVLLGTVLEVVYFLAQVPTGIIADLYSRRLSIIIGALLTGAGILAQGALPSFAGVVAGTVLWGIGAACIDGAVEAWAADEIGEERIGAVLTRGAQVDQAATVLGMGAAALLASVRLNLPLLVGAGVWLAVALFLGLAMPERHFHGVPAHERPNSFAAMGQQVVAGTRAARARPVLLLLFGATLFVALGSEGLDRLGQAHLLVGTSLSSAHVDGPPAGSSVGWLAGLSVAATVGSIGLTEVLRRRTDALSPAVLGRLLLWLQAVLVVGMAVFAVAGQFWLAALAWLVVRLVRSSTTPLWSTWVVAQTESATRATVFSAMGMVDAAGQIAGGPPVGLVGQRYSIRAALAASAVFTAPAVLFVAGALARQRRLPAAATVDAAATVKATVDATAAAVSPDPAPGYSPV